MARRIVERTEGDCHAGVAARWRDAAMRALRRALAAQEGAAPAVAGGAAAVVEVTLEDVA